MPASVLVLVLVPVLALSMFANDLASASAGASDNAAALHYLSDSLLQLSANF